MFECKVCNNAAFGKACSLGTHLWKTHGMKPQEYYDKYIADETAGKCHCCGNPTKFRTIGQGYMEFCSKRCAAKYIASDAERNAHKVNALSSTMEREYGVSNAAKLDSVKEKRKDTMLQKYGVEYYSRHPDFVNKYHDTNMRKFGATSYIGSEEGQANIRQHNIETIGVEYRYMLSTKDAISAYSTLLAKYDCILESFRDKKHITFKCNKCGCVCTEQDLFIKLRDSHECTPCSTCIEKHPHESMEEREVRDFIVNELGIEVTHYDRNFLGPYGADIVCENEKVIIEYDGIHWHNSAYVEPEYHLMKTALAETKGYHLIHIYSDEWLMKRDIVCSRLCNLLHRNIDGKSRKIYARKTTVVHVKDLEARTFLESNHIQGYVPAKYSIGLKYGDELVALMTFGKSRFSKDEYEMLRFCTKTYTSIVGGASKLFKYFNDNVDYVGTLVSYADRRWSSVDAFYPSLGFVKVSDGEIGYSYVIDGYRESRMKYQKHKLVKEGADPSKTEEEIMAERGYYRIYDCGNYKFAYITEIQKLTAR